MKDIDRQRDTKQRRLVYEAVLQRKDHPDADRIYLDVHAKDARISKATVYRNLRILAENGLIRHVKMPGADRYDFTLTNHHHVLCGVCGKVIDAPVEYLSEQDGIVESQTGFRIRGHQMVYEGICPECLREMGELRGDADQSSDT